MKKIDNIFIKKVEVGKYAIFEVIEKIKEHINLNNSNVFIKTIYNEILWLRNKKIFKIEIDNKIIDVWFCKIILYDDLIKECNLSVEEKDFFIDSNNTIRSFLSFLDDTHISPTTKKTKAKKAPKKEAMA